MFAALNTISTYQNSYLVQAAFHQTSNVTQMYHQKTGHLQQYGYMTGRQEMLLRGMEP